MNSKPEHDQVDPALTEAWDLARLALTEITPAETIGEPAGHLIEADGVVSLRFVNALPGYPGWHWTVSLSQLPGEEPTVLEVEAMPGSGALLAPEWVPWATRLAEYQAAQAAQAEADARPDDATDGEGADRDSDDDDLDDDDLDPDEDLDYDGDILYSGDLDGVDIDELDDSTPAEDEFDDDEPDDSERDEFGEAETLDADQD